MSIRRDDVDLERDRELVRRYQDGDAEAFAELHDRYFGRLRRYCARRVPDGAVAEELAQDAFVRALRALPALEGEQRFYPWLTVIARRLCIDYLRRQGRLTAVIDLRDPIDESPEVGDPHDVVAREIDLRALEHALGEVNPRHREVLRLREIEGLSYREIAERLGITVSTVETLLFRARKALQREFRAMNEHTKLLGAVGAAALQRTMARVRLAGDASSQQGIAEMSTLGHAVAALAATAGVLISGGGVTTGPTASPDPEPSRPTPITHQQPHGDETGASATGSSSGQAHAVASVASSTEVTPPTTTTSTSTSSPGPDAEPPPDVEAGPVIVYLDPEGEETAEEESRGMPIRKRVDKVWIGVDPGAITGWIGPKLPQPPGWERRSESAKGGN